LALATISPGHSAQAVHSSQPMHDPSAQPSKLSISPTPSMRSIPPKIEIFFKFFVPKILDGTHSSEKNPKNR
jgi:hypothetical protein